MATQTLRERASSLLASARFSSALVRVPARTPSTEPALCELPRERGAAFGTLGEQCEANR